MPLSRKLRIALGVYDRTLPLIAGLTTVEGVQTEFVCEPLESIFRRAFDEAEFDVSELSFSNFLLMTARNCCPYVAIPVFPSRSFRHSTIYIRSDRGICSPRDLMGKRIGVREYSSTAALVVRGMLQDEYGVDPAAVHWFCGRIDASDYPPVIRTRPKNIRLDEIDEDDNLSDALVDGRIDVLIAYRPPSAFFNREVDVVRMFEDYAAVERDYYRRTGLFPIMHVVGVRRDLVESDPTLCLGVSAAFERSKQVALMRLMDPQAPFSSLPWAGVVEAGSSLLGQNIWSYGIARNRRVLERQIEYSVIQGLIPQGIPVDDLFEASVRTWQP